MLPRCAKLMTIKNVLLSYHLMINQRNGFLKCMKISIDRLYPRGGTFICRTFMIQEKVQFCTWRWFATFYIFDS